MTPETKALLNELALRRIPPYSVWSAWMNAGCEGADTVSPLVLQADWFVLGILEDYTRLAYVAVKYGATFEMLLGGLRFYRNGDAWVLDIGTIVGKHPHSPEMSITWKGSDGQVNVERWDKAVKGAQVTLPADVFMYRTGEHVYPAARAREAAER